MNKNNNLANKNFKKKYYKYKKKYINLKRKNYMKRQSEGFSIPGKNHIGIKDSSRVEIKRKNYKDINREEFTQDLNNKNKNKILVINDIKSFDKFTDKYADIYEDSLYINWDKVANDFKGFYLETGNLDESDLYNNRFIDAIYKGNVYTSWWDYEYYEDDVILFVT